MRSAVLHGFASLVIVMGSYAMPARNPQKSVALPLEKLELHNVTAESVSYQGRRAVRVTDSASDEVGDAGRLAVVPGSSLQDGTIEVNLSGDTLPNVGPGARGFVGIAFRLSADRTHFECFYLRPKNGRSDDQLQRNHSAQYISIPGFPWQKLRSETPGKYESYVDLVAGEWTGVKIQVAGSSARLYVNGAAQPVLVVNDLKQSPTSGSVALWVGPGTVAHFADLKITP
jgi:hypothetical protein